MIRLVHRILATKNESHKWRDVPFVMHTLKYSTPGLEMRHWTTFLVTVWNIGEWKVWQIWGEWKACKCDKYEVNEKCISVTNIRWKKTVLYGNAEDLKQMKSLTLSCYLQMFSRVHGNQTPFFSLFFFVYLKSNGQHGIKGKTIYFVNMENASSLSQ